MARKTALELLMKDAATLTELRLEGARQAQRYDDDALAGLGELRALENVRCCASGSRDCRPGCRRCAGCGSATCRRS